MRVRAKKDGTYAGHYWNGPVDSDQGSIPGDVFDIDEKPYIVMDDGGNPIQEMEFTGNVDEKGNREMRKAWVTEGGKIKKDAKGNPIPKNKMATFFSAEWMEPVSEDTDLTYPDREPFRIPDAYRIKKQKQTKTVALPDELRNLASPI